MTTKQTAREKVEAMADVAVYDSENSELYIDDKIREAFKAGFAAALNAPEIVAMRTMLHYYTHEIINPNVPNDFLTCLQAFDTFKAEVEGKDGK